MNDNSQLVMLSDGFEMKTLTDDQELINRALDILDSMPDTCNYEHKVSSIVYALVIASNDKLTEYAAMSKEQAADFIAEHEHFTHTAIQCDVAQTQSTEDIALIRSVFMNVHDDKDFRNRRKAFFAKEQHRYDNEARQMLGQTLIPDKHDRTE